LRVLALGIALAATALLGCGPPPPNLLLIAVDTLRADRLGAYGYTRATSPAIDALFEESVVFEDAEGASAWTLPSFASLLTSLPPAAHLCQNAASRLADGHTTLAEILRDRGYETAAVVSHVFLGRRYGLHQGFDDYDDSLVLEIDASHRAISSPAINQRGVAWLEERAARDDSRPWFLWLHYFDPHHDYLVHPDQPGNFGTGLTDRYDGEIAFTDRHIGRLLSRLRKLGFERDTIVVFVSDHGEEFGDHGGGGHGSSLHREVTRLALAIRAPGIVPRRVVDPVHAVDLLPTLLDLLDVPEPQIPMTGRSLAPIMRGQATELEPVGMIAQTSLYHGAFWTSYRLGRWKLFERFRPGMPPLRELYDLRRDPLEHRDLASKHPEIVAEYSRALAEQVFKAREIAKRTGAEERLDLGEEDLKQLRALGYVE
jgi:arylsulfatase A-like enzyme